MCCCVTYEEEVHLTVRRLWNNRNKPDLHSLVANCHSNGRVFVECIEDGIQIDEHIADSKVVKRTVIAKSRSIIPEVAQKLIELQIDPNIVEI